MLGLKPEMTAFLPLELSSSVTGFSAKKGKHKDHILA